MYIYQLFFFFSSRRRHTRWPRDWSSDVCSSDLPIDGRPPDQSPRVPSWGAFGRRPSVRLIGHDGPASETLHLSGHAVVKYHDDVGFLCPLPLPVLLEKD